MKYNISEALSFIRAQKRFNKTNINLSYLITDTGTINYEARQIFTFISLHLPPNTELLSNIRRTCHD